MAYCPHSGRVVDEGDEFCANCARKLFRKIDNQSTLTPKGQRVTCPDCHGTGKGCEHPGCNNGHAWIYDW